MAVTLDVSYSWNFGCSMIRQTWVVKLGPTGVDVCLATGRVMHAGWDEIEAHTITPGGRIGALLVRAGKRRGGAIRVSPYLFNDTGDVDRLFDVLEPLLGQ